MSYYQTFNSFGYIIEDVPKEIMETLWKEVNEIQKDFDHASATNHTLAGNIQREYSLKDSISVVEPFAFNVAETYNELFKYNSNISVFKPGRLDFAVDTLWVNFQKKYEFNPAHTHLGLYSFVIYLQIPYDLNEELAASPGVNSNKNLASAFEFFYVNSFGKITKNPIFMDKTWEGKMLLFPAECMHEVHPFYTSDDYRISVAGNIAIQAGSK